MLCCCSCSDVVCGCAAAADAIGACAGAEDVAGAAAPLLAWGGTGAPMAPLSTGPLIAAMVRRVARKSDVLRTFRSHFLTLSISESRCAVSA